MSSEIERFSQLHMVEKKKAQGNKILIPTLHIDVSRFENKLNSIARTSSTKSNSFTECESLRSLNKGKEKKNPVSFSTIEIIEYVPKAIIYEDKHEDETIKCGCIIF